MNEELKQVVRRPHLEVALEDLMTTVQALQQTSLAYQQARAIAGHLAEDASISLDGAGLTLDIADLKIPIPMPTAPRERVDLIETAVAALGQEVVRLWNLAFDITSGARDHCQQAAEAAIAAANPPEQPAPTTPAS